MLYQILENRRVQLVSNLLAAAFGLHETGLLQDSEVPGDRGPARIKSVRDLSRRERSVPQESKNRSPSFISEGAERPIRSIHGSSLLVYLAH
jgi:hypothetical protein